MTRAVVLSVLIFLILFAPQGVSAKKKPAKKKPKPPTPPTWKTLPKQLLSIRYPDSLRRVNSSSVECGVQSCQKIVSYDPTSCQLHLDLAIRLGGTGRLDDYLKSEKAVDDGISARPDDKSCKLRSLVVRALLPAWGTCPEEIVSSQLCYQQNSTIYSSEALQPLKDLFNFDSRFNDVGNEILLRTLSSFVSSGSPNPQYERLIKDYAQKLELPPRELPGDLQPLMAHRRSIVSAYWNRGIARVSASSGYYPFVAHFNCDSCGPYRPVEPFTRVSSEKDNFRKGIDDIEFALKFRDTFGLDDSRSETQISEAEETYLLLYLKSRLMGLSPVQEYLTTHPGCLSEGQQPSSLLCGLVRSLRGDILADQKLAFYSLQDHDFVVKKFPEKWWSWYRRSLVLDQFGWTEEAQMDVTQAKQKLLRNFRSLNTADSWKLETIFASL